MVYVKGVKIKTMENRKMWYVEVMDEKEEGKDKMITKGVKLCRIVER